MIVQVSAGSLHSIVLTQSGEIFSWGHNPDCRLFKKIEFKEKSGKPKNINSPQKCEDLMNYKIV